MPRTMTTFQRQLLLCLCLVIGTVQNGEARPPIHEVLDKGSQWVLNVNGDEGTLTLLGGKGGQLPKGGFEIFYEIDFEGRKGTLEGVSDMKNAIQRVSIELTRKNGIKVSCQGFVAQETDDFMAGNCGDKIAPGAWYAVRRTAAPSPPSRLSTENQEEQKLRATLRATMQQHVRIQAKLGETMNELKRCRAQPKPLVQQPGKTSLNSLASFKNRVNGRYEDGKADGAPLMDFPQAPAGNSASDRWFRQLNGRLLDTLKLGLGSETNAFLKLESNNCRGENIFCQVAHRQQAIYLMLGGK